MPGKLITVLGGGVLLKVCDPTTSPTSCVPLALEDALAPSALLLDRDLTAVALIVQLVPDRRTQTLAA